MVVDPESGNTRYETFHYQGREMDIWRLYAASDGIYGSTYIPAYLFHLAPEGGAIETIGLVGGGEVYSMLEIGERLFLAGYSLAGPVMAYNRSAEFNLGWSPLRNPRLIGWPGWKSSWRPVSLLSAPNGKAYIGAIAGYGLLESPLFELDPVSLEVRQYPIAKDQSILILGPDGRIWGLHYTGLFAIDLQTHAISQIVQVNFRVRGGIAVYGDYIYFTSRTAIWRYKVVKGILPDIPLLGQD